MKNKEHDFLTLEYAFEHFDEFPECRKFCTSSGEIIFDDVSIINSLCLFKGELHQIMSKAAIESALGNQYQPYSRRELVYASVYKSLVLNHGFMNGTSELL